MTANSANAGCAIVCTGMRGFSTTQLDKAAVQRIRDCHPLVNNTVGAAASPRVLHWALVRRGSAWGAVGSLGTATTPLLSQWCPKPQQGATEGCNGSCSSSLPQPPLGHGLHWLKTCQRTTSKRYNCSINALSAETSYISLVVYNIGGSTLYIVHLPSATGPRQGFSKLQPCYQGCHAAQRRQNHCSFCHVLLQLVQLQNAVICNEIYPCLVWVRGCMPLAGLTA